MGVFCGLVSARSPGKSRYSVFKVQDGVPVLLKAMLAHLVHEKGATMYVSHYDAVMRLEQYQDLLQDAKRERLIRATRLQPTASVRLYRKAANWLGTQLVRWGQNLRYPGTTPACSEQAVRVRRTLDAAM